MRDANAILQTASTISATTTSPVYTGIVTNTPRRGIKFSLPVTSLAGTAPTLTAKVQGSLSSAGTYTDLSTFNNGVAISAAGEYFATVDTDFPYIRVLETVAGTLPIIALGEICVVTGRP